LKVYFLKAEVSKSVSLNRARATLLY